MTAVRIGLEPASVRSYLGSAIEAGGGVVTPVAECEGLVWADPRDSAGLRAALDANPAVRWVQLPFAGIEPFVPVLDHDRIWTAAKGVYAEEVAEHALAMALAGLRNLVGYARQDEWSKPVGRNLLGANITILGGGGITTSLVRMLGPFGCDITVLRRSAEPFPGAQRTGTLDELDEVLTGTDVLFIALALTAETTGVIDAGRLAQLPEHAWIVNVGRGRHIVTEDLVAALSADRIGGAALDVTDPEPLPADHPLWALPNCLITPHTANTPEMAVPVLARRVTENVRRFAAGEELLGIVDIDAGY